jgi:hypothetical protein
MQEREEMHRGCRGLRRAGVLSATLLALIVAAQPAPCRSGCPAPRGGLGESNVLAGRIGLLRDFQKKRFAGVFSAFENPYLIEGLVSSNLLVGFGNRSSSIWLDWSRLGHRLYSEDRVSALCGLGFPVKGLRGAAIPAIERREVKGFAAQYAHSLRLSASYECERAVRVAFEGSAYESDPAERRDAVLSLAFRSTSLAVQLDRFLSGLRAGDMGFAVEVRLHESCSFLSTYRSKTAEISGGLLVEVSPILLCLTWRQHPVLGSTMSVEVGRVWEW